MFSVMKQQVVVGKDGKIEIQTSEFAEGTVVEVIILVEQDNLSDSKDETEYLLSTKANRDRLMAAIQNVATETNLVSFTPEEWNAEHNIRS